MIDILQLCTISCCACNATNSVFSCYISKAIRVDDLTAASSGETANVILSRNHHIFQTQVSDLTGHFCKHSQIRCIFFHAQSLDLMIPSVKCTAVRCNRRPLLRQCDIRRKLCADIGILRCPFRKLQQLCFIGNDKRRFRRSVPGQRRHRSAAPKRCQQCHTQDRRRNENARDSVSHLILHFFSLISTKSDIFCKKESDTVMHSIVYIVSFLNKNCKIFLKKENPKQFAFTFSAPTRLRRSIPERQSDPQ